MEGKIEELMELIDHSASDLDSEQRWEFYRMLAFRLSSRADDLEDQEEEKQV